MHASDMTLVTIIVLTFFVGGLVKGLTGLGLPPVVLGILTAAVGIQPGQGADPRAHVPHQRRPGVERRARP
ncbi:hypothetical protein GCM10020256_44860 [Streptomyces thermocoprophilus]